MDNFWILSAACVGIGLPSAWLALRWYWRKWTDAMIQADPFFEPYGDVPHQRPEIRRQRTGNAD